VFEQKIAVTMADGNEHLAVVDQRDLAAAEAQFPDGTRAHTHIRFLAWSALLRAKLINLTWDKFNKVDCVEASDPKPDEETELDPTTPAASAGS
jgi:hypothetical protein